MMTVACYATVMRSYRYWLKNSKAAVFSIMCDMNDNDH